MTILEKHNTQSATDPARIDIASLDAATLEQAQRELRELKLEPSLLRLHQ